MLEALDVEAEDWRETEEGHLLEGVLGEVAAAAVDFLVQGFGEGEEIERERERGGGRGGREVEGNVEEGVIGGRGEAAGGTGELGS